MTSISPNHSNKGHEAMEHEEAVIIERIKKKAQVRRLRKAQKLAARMQVAPDGSKTFLRFSQSERLEHQVLIVTFTILAITGLLQRYSANVVIGWIINMVFGGVETLRTLHHLNAAVFILEAFYHLGKILYVWFAQREKGSMWPARQDFGDMLQMIKYNLGLTGERAAFDRFSIEEKVEYWALLWGSVIMILTGLIQWFPTIITQILPGDVIPVSRAIHGWEAVLAVLSVIIWHMYHTVIKEKNKSIFTGTMAEKEMHETHPIEYRRILAAHKFLRKLSAKKSKLSPKEQRPKQQV